MLSTYANIITSADLGGAALAIVMNSDREAISQAVRTVVRVKPQDCRILRIENTLQLSESWCPASWSSLCAGIPSASRRFRLLPPPRSTPTAWWRRWCERRMPRLPES
jgi:hypothetical protein